MPNLALEADIYTYAIHPETTIPLNPIQEDMADQLDELYAEKDILEARFPGLDADGIVAAVRNVRERLAARTGEPANVADLDRASEPLEHVPYAEVEDSLEAQLIELYAEREILDRAFPGMSVREIVDDFGATLARLDAESPETETAPRPTA